MFKWSAIVDHLKSMHRYIAFSVILFMAGLVVGATNSALHGYLGGQVEAIRELGETLRQSSDPTLSFMVFIFINNAVKAVFVIYLGALLGIVPAFFLVVNGMVLGYLFYLKQLEAGAGGTLDMFLRGILPHGILEIPAVVVAAAYGLKFGALVWKRIFIPGGKGAEGAGTELRRFVPRTVPLGIVVVAVLLVASIIESTITPWLMGTSLS
ncbi:stage II sporulation protein M [Paenibacillus thailandensis]|uniref:Stage II sporulation protein M n=1 Tax=Paenibacillus thailandensis TaxID=393250 RepID=A0ABW5R2C3_9BACL